MDRLEFDNLSTRKRKAITDAYRAQPVSGIPPACSRMSLDAFIGQIGSPDDRLTQSLNPPDSAAYAREELARQKYLADRAADLAHPEVRHEESVEAAMKSETVWRKASPDVQREALRRNRRAQDVQDAARRQAAYEGHAKRVAEELG